MMILFCSADELFVYGLPIQLLKGVWDIELDFYSLIPYFKENIIFLNNINRFSQDKKIFPPT